MICYFRCILKKAYWFRHMIQDAARDKHIEFFIALLKVSSKIAKHEVRFEF
jgi:hypothetical protein